MTIIQIRIDNKIQEIELSQIPEYLLQYGFEFEIDISKVWALITPTVNFPVSELLWHMDMTPWADNTKPFSVAPKQVLDNPQIYPEHYEKILNADCSYPLDIAFNNGRWIVIDGLHRLCSQIKVGLQENGFIAVRVHSTESLISCMDIDITPKHIAEKYFSSVKKINTEKIDYTSSLKNRQKPRI